MNELKDTNFNYSEMYESAYSSYEGFPSTFFLPTPIMIVCSRRREIPIDIKEHDGLYFPLTTSARMNTPDLFHETDFYEYLDIEINKQKDVMIERVLQEYMPSVFLSKAQTRQTAIMALKKLIDIGSQEIFEDGMDSLFAIGLKTYIKQYSKMGIDILSDTIFNSSIGYEIASEALRCMGHLKDKATYQDRLCLLSEGLRSESTLVRDGAVLGLSFLNDSNAKKILIEYKDIEKHMEMINIIDEAIRSIE